MSVGQFVPWLFFVLAATLAQTATTQTAAALSVMCLIEEVSMSTKPSFKHIRQVYKVTYPTGKIYIGKDLYGSYRYFGSPDPEIVNKDFESLTDSEKKKYSVTKEILWESASCSEKELAQKEVEFIREFDSNNPAVGYNRWPKHQKNTDHG